MYQAITHSCMKLMHAEYFFSSSINSAHVSLHVYTDWESRISLNIVFFVVQAIICPYPCTSEGSLLRSWAVISASVGLVSIGTANLDAWNIHKYIIKSCKHTKKIQKTIRNLHLIWIWNSVHILHSLNVLSITMSIVIISGYWVSLN